MAAEGASAGPSSSSSTLFDEPVLFAALPTSQTLSFTHLTTSTPILSLRAPPNSSYLPATQSSLGPLALPPRKTVVFHPSMGLQDFASLVMTLSGKDGRNGLDYWNSLAGAGKGGGGTSLAAAGKVVPMGRATAVAVSKTGTWLAVGTADGRVMMWDLGTGTLVATFDAHYRAVTCLAFTPNDDALVTGSEDSIASVWHTGAIINAAATPLTPPKPYALLADHTLPISDIAISIIGIWPGLRILTASLDGTVKMWSTGTPDKPLLATFQLPGPAHHVVFDHLERYFFASYPTPAPLSKPSTTAGTSTSTAPARTGSTVVRVDLFTYPPQNAMSGGTGGVPLFPIPAGTSHAPPSASPTYSTPSSLRITALHLPSVHCGSTPQLLLGLSNGSVVHLSLPDLQPTRTTAINSAGSTAGEDDPVVLLSTLRRPIDLITASSSAGMALGFGSSGKGKGAASKDVDIRDLIPPPRPVGALGRAIGRSGTSTNTSAATAPPPNEAGATDDDAYLRSLFSRTCISRPPFVSPSDAAYLASVFSEPDDRTQLQKDFDRAKDGGGKGRRGYAAGLASIRREWDPWFGSDGGDRQEDDWALDPEMKYLGAETGFTSLGRSAAAREEGGDGGKAEATALKDEVEALRAQLSQALDLNDAMWKGIVEGTLKLPEDTAEPMATGEGEAGTKGKGRKRPRTVNGNAGA